jgi:hypothetical protein
MTNGRIAATWPTSTSSCHFAAHSSQTTQTGYANVSGNRSVWSALTNAIRKLPDHHIFRCRNQERNVSGASV